MVDDRPLRRQRLRPGRQDAVDGEQRPAGGSGGRVVRRASGLVDRLEALSEEHVAQQVLGIQHRRRAGPLGAGLRRRLDHPIVLLNVTLLRILGHTALAAPL